MEEFYKFPKIARWSRDVVVTEKIDGTNASVYIGEDYEFLTGCRTRWITPEEDNFGFSAWAHEHKEELIVGLGPGRHFGEWWGNGIQRGYGLPKGERRFSLFNVERWKNEVLPAFVGLVPVLWTGNMDELDVGLVLDELRSKGSRAITGFMNPEGVVVYHKAARCTLKKTLEGDTIPKGMGQVGSTGRKKNESNY